MRINTDICALIMVPIFIVVGLKLTVKDLPFRQLIPILGFSALGVLLLIFQFLKG